LNGVVRAGGPGSGVLPPSPKLLPFLSITIPELRPQRTALGRNTRVPPNSAPPEAPANRFDGFTVRDWLRIFVFYFVIFPIFLKLMLYAFVAFGQLVTGHLS
jgi:hypothetical protein